MLNRKLGSLLSSHLPEGLMRWEHWLLPPHLRAFRPRDRAPLILVLRAQNRASPGGCHSNNVVDQHQSLKAWFLALIWQELLLRKPQPLSFR